MLLKFQEEYKQKLSSLFNLDGRAGANELKELFTDTGKIFTNPKTIKLLSEFVSFSTRDRPTIEQMPTRTCATPPAAVHSAGTVATVSPVQRPSLCHSTVSVSS